MDNKNNSITRQEDDFAQWYTDVVKAARLATYSNTKGCIVFEPNGYALWERMQEILDKNAYKVDYEDITSALLFDYVDYKTAVTSLEAIISQKLFK